MISTSTFKPAWYLRNPHLQTLAANLVRPVFPDVEYETIELPDGDRLTLAHNPVSGSARVLILHGLEGSLDSAYARRILNFLSRQGVPATFMFFRGCDGHPNRLARSYHSGETGDLQSVIDHLLDSGTKRLALIGYSLGGNVTLKYLGESVSHPNVICAIAVSVPLLLGVCARRMDQGFSKIYQHELMTRMKKKVVHKKHLLLEAGLDVDKQTRNFAEFDDQFTAPLHGFENADSYYQQCSSRQFLKNITIPTLLIHALDDPFMTPEVIPEINELSKTVTLELSSHGGHVGFIEKGIFRQTNWLEPRLFAWLIEHFLQPEHSAK